MGPGPYTSTRVGVAIVRALGFALGIEVVGGVLTMPSLPSSLTRLPADSDTRDFIVATDARRREVYWARYDAYEIVGPDQPWQNRGVARIVCEPGVGGNGLDRYPTWRRIP